MNLHSQHWTKPSTKTLPSSVLTQFPAFEPPTSQVSNSQPVPHPNTLNVPMCAPFSSQLQTFDGTDYRHPPENVLNGITARTIYQHGPEPSKFRTVSDLEHS